MKFTKYHGTGNDFIVLIEKDLEGREESETAKALCHRNYGIGADGLLIVKESQVADLKMAYYNQDGSVAPMCGNGLRCFARFAHENDLVENDRFQVETLAGILPVDVSSGYERIRIGLMKPSFHLTAPHVRREVYEGEILNLAVNGRSYDLHVLFLGTLHAVVFTEDEVPYEDADGLCHHEFFPEHINVNFVKVESEEAIRLLTFERGVGYTLACGTGAASAQVTAHKLGFTKPKAKVHVDGGMLEVTVKDQVFLEGPAVCIAKGEMEIGQA
ncbi:diaminopimelate epimerase [Proteiniclasticum sp. C24MP]|uniref:diaminopimelate epimerase n=1 Tax=Proteiniclasticum sp. C24MP TaxID=3374101 RepID=UPI003754470A